MTESSNRKDSKPQQPERDADASSNPSEPIQLELFERWTGERWTRETPYESKPSRDFILPRAPAKAPSAPPSKEEPGND
jgi:hypothetical protein